MDSFANDRSAYSSSTRETLIREKGAELWMQYIPPLLAEQFWSVADSAKRMTILSSGDPLPWEIFNPIRPGAASGDFLVERFQLVRWRGDIGIPAAKLGLGSTRFVAPRSGLSGASAEVNDLRRLSPALHDGETITTIEEMLATIAAGDFDLLHFASHNVALGPQKGVPFGGGQYFEPTFLTTAAGTHAYEGRRPLVFMNACRTAAELPLYTSLSGWADKFIEAGAGAFVGTLWAIGDKPARAFAEQFYTALLAGTTVGSAAKAGRDAIRIDGDPTRLAYAVFADPLATLDQGRVW
jgi:hypothetical protein